MMVMTRVTLMMCASNVSNGLSVERVTCLFCFTGGCVERVTCFASPVGTGDLDERVTRR